VVQHGRIVLEGYAPGFDERSLFNTQSMHRGLLALAVFAAIADGLIPSLDARAEECLPLWRGDPRGRITIADLLFGESGLASPKFDLAIDSPGLQLFIGADLERAALATPAVAASASVFRPSEVDAQLLGLILERATRTPYATYLSKRLWQPIGASSAYVQLDRPGGHSRTFCCIRATARDWARVGELVLERGRVGTRQIIPESLADRVHAPAPRSDAVGAFWFRRATALGPRPAGAAQAPLVPTDFQRGDVFFTGGRGGQRVYVVPSLGAIVVRIGRIRSDFDDGKFLNPFLAALAAPR
jgi:CubicO group peptidase (beta-lactamase class C family)